MSRLVQHLNVSCNISGEWCQWCQPFKVNWKAISALKAFSRLSAGPALEKRKEHLFGCWKEKLVVTKPHIKSVMLFRPFLFFCFENSTQRKNQTDQQHQWFRDLIFRVERFAIAKNFLSTLLLASLSVGGRWRQEHLGDLQLGALDRWRPSGSDEARDNDLRRKLHLLAGW